MEFSFKYDHHPGVSQFYDNVSAHVFWPLILQPFHVSSTSATLIDNIFTNDLSCFSKEGNITTSISDHFIQFSILDILGDLDTNPKKTLNVSR